MLVLFTGKNNSWFHSGKRCVKILLLKLEDQDSFIMVMFLGIISLLQKDKFYTEILYYNPTKHVSGLFYNGK